MKISASVDFSGVGRFWKKSFCRFSAATRTRRLKFLCTQNNCKVRPEDSSEMYLSQIHIHNQSFFSFSTNSKSKGANLCKESVVTLFAHSVVSEYHTTTSNYIRSGQVGVEIFGYTIYQRDLTIFKSTEEEQKLRYKKYFCREF